MQPETPFGEAFALAVHHALDALLGPHLRRPPVPGEGNRLLVRDERRSLSRHRPHAGHSSGATSVS